MLEGCKQNLVHTRTEGKEKWSPKRQSQTCLWVFQSVRRRHRSALAWGGDGGSGCSRPGRCGVWRKSSWRRSPLAPLYSHRADNPQDWRIRPKKFSHCCKSSRAHNRFPNLRIQQRDWEPQGIWLWRPVGFDYRTSTGKSRKTDSWRAQTKPCAHQEKGAVAP